jgi:hypothetical protein
MSRVRGSGRAASVLIAVAVVSAVCGAGRTTDVWSSGCRRPVWPVVDPIVAVDDFSIRNLPFVKPEGTRMTKPVVVIAVDVHDIVLCNGNRCSFFAITD